MTQNRCLYLLVMKTFNIPTLVLHIGLMINMGITIRVLYLSGHGLIASEVAQYINRNKALPQSSSPD